MNNPNNLWELFKLAPYPSEQLRDEAKVGELLHLAYRASQAAMYLSFLMLEEPEGSQHRDYIGRMAHGLLQKMNQEKQGKNAK